MRVRAAGVGSTDLIMLAGKYLYAPKIPFVPGYEVAGVVEAIGADFTGFTVGQRVTALTAQSSFAELLVREAEHFLSIPDGVSDRDAAAVILNYAPAWQMIRRVAQVTGAAAGVGTAVLQLLRLAGVTTYGAASAQASHLARTRRNPNRLSGGVARSPCVCPPTNLRVSTTCSTLGGANIGLCIGALRRGTFYGITSLYQRDPKPLREDLPKIFALLADWRPVRRRARSC